MCFILLYRGWDSSIIHIRVKEVSSLILLSLHVIYYLYMILLRPLRLETSQLPPRWTLHETRWPTFIIASWCASFSILRVVLTIYYRMRMICITELRSNITQAQLVQHSQLWGMPSQALQEQRSPILQSIH
jgi:hypothetical protein